MTKTPLEMLELLVDASRQGTDKAFETMNPNAMVMHYNSQLINEARQVIDAARKDYDSDAEHHWTDDNPPICPECGNEWLGTL